MADIARRISLWIICTIGDIHVIGLVGIFFYGLYFRLSSYL